MKWIFLAVAVTGFLAAKAEAAAKFQKFFPASICHPVSGSAAAIDYSQYGVHNNSAAPATVECPLVISHEFGVNEFVTRVSLQVYDRSTTADISCDVTLSDFTGNITLSSNLKSTGGFPGSSVVTIGPFIPSPGSAPAASSSQIFWNVRCTIPAAVGTAFSHVVGIYMETER